MRCFSTKTYSVKDDLMSTFCFDMQLFKKTEFGWVEQQYLQTSIKGRCIQGVVEKQPILLLAHLSRRLMR